MSFEKAIVLFSYFCHILFAIQILTICSIASSSLNTF